MCLGGGQSINIPEPVAPEVKYIGPSEDDIARQQQGLQDYQTQISQQQTDFETRLNEQIASANQQTEDLRTQFAGDLVAEERASAASQSAASQSAAADVAAAGSASAAQQVGAYSVSTQESEAVAPQTTQAVTEKKKPKKNLKISTAGTASTAGSGLNIGV